MIRSESTSLLATYAVLGGSLLLSASLSRFPEFSALRLPWMWTLLALLGRSVTLYGLVLAFLEWRRDTGRRSYLMGGATAVLTVSSMAAGLEGLLRLMATRTPEATVVA